MFKDAKTKQAQTLLSFRDKITPTFLSSLQFRYRSGSTFAEEYTRSSFQALVHDAKRFILAFRSAIEVTPLQAHCSGLIFSPKASIIRKNFWNQVPSWITRIPEVSDNWSPYIQTLEGHL